MVCVQCGRAVADSDRFCGGCGAAVVSACRRCGRPLDAAVAFCTNCGTLRDEPAPVSVPTEDRRKVSVLFIDLVDFTPYVESADPELVRRLQHRFYTAVRRVVGQHGGVVEKYIGDAVMALFGAPVATETDALRCVRAGLELQRVLPGHATESAPDLQFRIGVATGEALVDVSAARDGGQAIVAGDVVTSASRLQSVAPAGGVLVCGQTHRLTANGVRYAARPAVTLRGRSSPTEVWLALAPLPRPRVDPEPDASPMVGRDHELDLLTGALRRAVQDRTPQLVTVFGQAGIGKSRLVRELRRVADDTAGTHVVWHTGNCPPFGENVIYAGLADIVKAEAGILDTDPAATTRQRLDQAVRRVVSGAEADRLGEALQPLVGLPGRYRPAEAEDAESGWRRYLVALAGRGPTVLVFEDMHWADEAMLRFVELLAAAARDVPLLVLCTARPELVDRDASWAGTIYGSLTITLSPLRGEGMTILCRHLLGQAAFTTEVLRPLVEVTGGNPLYAQEYVRMLVDRGTLSQAVSPTMVTSGSEAGTGTGPPMPDSVHAVIANRLDLLDPADRAALQAASVVGMQFWPGAVAAALGRPTGSVERSLRRLEQREFISEHHGSTMAGQGEFRFGHVLVRDVCYQRLPRTERIARHERTAVWLETLSGDRDNDLAEVIAHHRWAACEIARTVGVPAHHHAPAARLALHRAAQRAFALHALDVAASYAARALALLSAEGQPAVAGPAGPESTAGPGGSEGTERPAGTDERARLRLELLATEIAYCRDRPGFLAGGGADQLRSLAERLTDLTGSASDAARAWTLLGQAAWLQADRDSALKFLNRSITLLDPLPDSPEKVDAYGELGRLHMLNYECEPAIAAASTAAGIANRLGLAEAHANARITMATARYESGHPNGLTELREITALCRANQLLALPRATRNLALLVREEGDWPRSAELLAEGLERDVPGSHNAYTDFSGEVMCAYFTGDLDTIAAVSDEMVRQPGSAWADVRSMRANVRALRDEPLTGSDDLADALAAARGSGFYRAEWEMLAKVAHCRALQQRGAEAAQLLTELTTQWQKVPVIASGGWVGWAAFAAAMTGPEQAEALRAPLAALPRRTPWSEAALQTVSGAMATAGGGFGEAARRHLAAAEIYRRIPAVTDRVLSLALAAAAFTRAGEPDRAAPALAEVRPFVQRTSARALLRIAEPAAAEPAASEPAASEPAVGGPAVAGPAAGEASAG